MCDCISGAVDKAFDSLFQAGQIICRVALGPDIRPAHGRSSESRDSTKQTRLLVQRDLTFPAVGQERLRVDRSKMEKKVHPWVTNTRHQVSVQSKCFLQPITHICKVAGWCQDCDTKPWNRTELMELQGMLIHDLDLAWLLKPADLHNHKLPVAIKHICILELIFSAWGFQL